MFGIGLGEILLILLVVFFISPKELPKFMKKVGEFLGLAERVKKELFSINKDVRDILDEASIDGEMMESTTVQRREPKKTGAAETPPKGGTLP